MASLLTDDNDTTTTTRRRTTTATETSEQMTDNELSHFEDLPGILQIYISSYIADDILAMINMFAITSTKFLECEPLRQKYFKVVVKD